MTPEFVCKIIQYEKPDGIYVTFGGQTVLDVNVGIKLKDEFAALGVQVLGTLIETVIALEDRQLFAAAMEQIDEKCTHSVSATTTDEVIVAAAEIGYPVIVRARWARLGLCSERGAAQGAVKKGICNESPGAVVTVRFMRDDAWANIPPLRHHQSTRRTSRWCSRRSSPSLAPFALFKSRALSLSSIVPLSSLFVMSASATFTHHLSCKRRSPPPHSPRSQSRAFLSHFAHKSVVRQSPSFQNGSSPHPVAHHVTYAV
jgi:hypothetical protein